ncbi:hypothetical protein MLD52_03985 [Puniceicoccaceae bacterium K14]|nr:hypothetical protein [Puniceicoccaceae bacterium K14]
MNLSFALLFLLTTTLIGQPEFSDSNLYGTWKHEDRISVTLTCIGLTTYNSDNTFTTSIEKLGIGGIKEKVHIQGSWKIEEKLITCVGRQRTGYFTRDYYLQCEIIELTENKFTYVHPDGRMFTEKKVISRTRDAFH